MRHRDIFHIDRTAQMTPHRLYRLAWRVTFNLKNPASLAARIKWMVFPKQIKLSTLANRERGKISILVITFNSLDYIKKCLTSLNNFRPQNTEVIVYDNNSDDATTNYLQRELAAGRIDKLHLSPINHYFVKGNNEAAKLAADDSEYYLLLNSDTEILDARWLDCLLQITPTSGISALGHVSYPFPRPDGWCFMVDAKTFKDLGGLDEYYQMNWGITDFTSRVLGKNLPVRTIINPDQLIVHYGGKSYGTKQRAEKFNLMTSDQVIKAFAQKQQQFFKIA